MTSLALSDVSPLASAAGFAVRPRSVHWLGLLVILAGISLPNCCLTGCHMFGAGMEEFGFICHAYSRERDSS
jgi:hypothetical protein